jgi:hypothetical protein
MRPVDLARKVFETAELELVERAAATFRIVTVGLRQQSG